MTWLHLLAMIENEAARQARVEHLFFSFLVGAVVIVTSLIAYALLYGKAVKLQKLRDGGKRTRKYLFEDILLASRHQYDRACRIGGKNWIENVIRFFPWLLCMIVFQFVFGVYLFLLLVLLVATFVIWMPARIVDAVWMLYRRVVYPCPYPDDGSRGRMPIHVCECGTWYHDLRPNFYGVFHHVCTNRHKHQNGGYVRLPTIDLLGRNHLTRLCGSCERPLLHAGSSELPFVPIALIGGPETGKTSYLVQLLADLYGKGLMAFGSVRDESWFVAQYAELDAMSGLRKTIMSPPAIGLELNLPGRRKCFAHLFDLAGDDFLTLEAFQGLRAIQFVSGLILFADGTRMPQSGDDEETQREFRSLVERFIAQANTLLVTNPRQSCTIPLVVLLTKVDRISGRSTRTRGLAESLAVGSSTSGMCREVLVELGAERELEMVEAKFGDVTYFASQNLDLADPALPPERQPHGTRPPLAHLVGRCVRKGWFRWGRAD